MFCSYQWHLLYYVKLKIFNMAFKNVVNDIFATQCAIPTIFILVSLSFHFISLWWLMWTRWSIHQMWQLSGQWVVIATQNETVVYHSSEIWIHGSYSRFTVSVSYPQWRCLAQTDRCGIWRTVSWSQSLVQPVPPGRARWWLQGVSGCRQHTQH